MASRPTVRFDFPRAGVFPTRDDFVRLAEHGNIIPVCRAVLADTETPVSAFRKVGGERHAFLLESVEGGEKVGRYSILGREPFRVIRSRGREVTIEGRGGVRHVTLDAGRDPLDVLRAELASFRPVTLEGLPPFTGGAVGYIGYDLVRFFEHLPATTPDDLGLPDLYFVLTDTCLIFDRVKHGLLAVANAVIEGDPGAAYDAAVAKVDALLADLQCPSLPPASRDGTAETITHSNLTQGEFESKVTRAKDYIAAGDVIQVVLSRRWECPVTCPPFDIYRALRAVNPSPYMYYLAFEGVEVVGASPEQLVGCRDDIAVTRPIAGTRPRGQSDAEDARLVAELLADPKERAEHLMLVDLGRNDLGRVCDYGTVRVDPFMTIEKYSHVSHIVSEVRGRLRPGLDAFDLLRAAFPAGTVSGAPKVRAMEIIEELEPVRRGPYAGAVGYIGFDGTMDTAITIRTIVCAGGQAYIQAGAGIVADSIPSREYEETENKARAMRKAIDLAMGGL